MCIISEDAATTRSPDARDGELMALRAENAALRARVLELLARVQELAARLAKDSHGSQATILGPALQKAAATHATPAQPEEVRRAEGPLDAWTDLRYHSGT